MLSLLYKLVVVLLQARRSLLQQSHQLMLMLYRHNQKFFLFQILWLLQLLLVSFPTTLQRLLETTMKIPKAIAMERRLIIPVLPLV